MQSEPSENKNMGTVVVFDADTSSPHLLGLQRLIGLATSAKGISLLAVTLFIILGGGAAALINLTSKPKPSFGTTPSSSSSTSAKPNIRTNPSHVTTPPGSGSATSSTTTTPSKSVTSVVSTTQPHTTQSSTISSSVAASTPASTSSPPPSSSSTGSSSGSSGGNVTPTYSGCSYQGTVAPCIGSSTTGASGWGSPVFDDEFNGTSVNTNIWNVTNNWTNQNGVTTSSSNVTESNGNLILTLASSSSGAEIETSSYALPVGGFAEARISFPGSGTTVYNWPAWWVSGPNWPQAGEADIFEGLGTASTNYHYYSNGDQQAGPFYISGTWVNNYYTFGLYRGSNYNNVYWDGSLVKSYSTSDNGQPETLILTVGLASGNTPAYGTASQVKVDYVRAWQ